MSESLTVTNVGDKAQKVQATTRTLSHTVSDKSGSAAIDTATGPAYIDAFGISRSFTTVHFKVAPHVDRLTMWAAAPTAPFAGRIILIDPSGAYTAYSIPQGAANIAMSDVAHPAAGTWTAYLALSTSSRFSGNFVWRVLQQDFRPDGFVFPSSFTLAPGASRRVTVIGQEPSQPGDESASVQLSGSVSGRRRPCRSRSEPWRRRETTRSAGTITGGNGRGFRGQANVYYLRRARVNGTWASASCSAIRATRSSPR